MTTIETTSTIVTGTWKLLVIGGVFSDPQVHRIADVDKVDPNKKSSKCEKTMPYPTVISEPIVQAFPDQSVLSCGGRDGPNYVKSCYEYNPNHLNWSYVADMIYDRGHARSVPLNDNEIDHKIL